MMSMTKYSVKIFALSLLIIVILISTASAQNQIKDGITISEIGDVTVFYDEFTGKYAISVSDSAQLSSLDKGNDESSNSIIIPFFGGSIYDKYFGDLVWSENWSEDFIIILIREDSEKDLFEKEGSNQIPFLLDGKRLAKSSHYFKRASTEILEITFTPVEWKDIVNSTSSKYRISGEVFTIDKNTKNLMDQILNQYQNLKEEEKKATKVTYDLSFEGGNDRAPMLLSLPNNIMGQEETLKIRFEVRPDGTIGRIIPLRKIYPELEVEIMRTLRSWQFSRLSSRTPQQSQWGMVTFRFTLE